MGCDIHLMAERKVYHYTDDKKEKGTWMNIDKWIFNEDAIRWQEPDSQKRALMVVDRDSRFYTGGRNYNLFCALAGVRKSQFYNNPPIISNPKGLPKDASKVVRAESRRWAGDGHSHSWVTLAEIKAFDWSEYGATCDSFRINTVKKLEDAKDSYNTDDEVRVIFWFDN